jgi:threonine/homoserine/homoserine lactone efflux protein
MDSIFIPANLLLMYSVYFIGTASPGPSNMTIMVVALHQGRKPALMLALGVITGSIVWGLLAGFGFASVLAAAGNFLVALKIAGALYLLWLAYCAGRSALTNRLLTQKQAGSLVTSNKELYLRGVAMHITNPKAVFSWLATISIGLPENASHHDVFVGLLGCFALGIFTFTSYALIFSMKKIGVFFVGSRRWFDGALAAIYSYAGIRLLFSKI